MKITTARLKELEELGRSAMPMKAEFTELISKYERGIPDEALCFFNGGTEEWACVNGDFISQAESPIGFGSNFEEALDDFKKHI